MDLAFDETRNLPTFVVRLVDIFQELAGHVIGDIYACEDLKDVVCLYHGDYQTGTAEFIIRAPTPTMGCFVDSTLSNLTEKLDKSQNTNYRHLITTLCAALSQSIGIRTTTVDQNSQFKSELVDNMFDFVVFNCISSRLSMIDYCRSHMTDFVTGARCGVCPFGSRKDVDAERNGNIVTSRYCAINDCHLYTETSEKLNNILGALTLNKSNTIRFMSRSQTPGRGTLTTKFLSLDNLINILDLEQFLALKGLLK